MSKIRLHGTSSGYTDIAPTAAAGNNTLTAPTGTGTLVAEDSSGNITISDGVVHTGDTNTKIRFPSADTITAETGGSERLRIASDGAVTVAANGSVVFTNGTWSGEVAGKIQQNSNKLYLQGGTSGWQFRSSGGTSRLEIDGDGNTNITGITTAAAFAPSVGWLGNRNMIINGGMTVSQRGTQTSITSATYTLDRWRLAVTNCGAYTVSQLGGSDELINTGGRNSLKVDCTTADASPAASDLVLIQQPLEGLVTNPLCWGTSGAKKAVLSFMAKADVNGWSSGTKDFVVEIQTSDSQEFSAVCQLAAAGTWQKFVIPIDAKTSSAIAYDNTESMGINWWLDAGTNFKGGTGVTGWSAKANSGGVRAAQQTLAIAAHTDNNFYLTNVQFEVSDTYATPFESRSFGDELRRCQRYFQRVNGSLYGIGASATSIRANYTPPVNFRVSPTITGNAAVTFNNPGINSPTQSSFNCGIQHTYTPNNIGIGLGFGNFTNATQGYTYIQWDADDEYILSLIHI